MPRTCERIYRNETPILRLDYPLRSAILSNPLNFIITKLELKVMQPQI